MTKFNLAPTRRHLLAGLGGLAGAAALPACFAQGTTAQHYDAIIIGAGLAGLHAARILEGEGARLLVLESSGRVGGRMFTLDDTPSRPEAGGLQVGPMYARLRSTARELGVELEEFPPSSRGMTISYDGHSTSLRDWANWPHNPLTGKMRGIPPFLLLNKILPNPNPLPELDSWKDPAFFKYDVPVRRYIDNLEDAETIKKFIGVSLQGSDVDDVSVLGELRKNRVMLFERENGKNHKIKGGSSRLPEAMAQSLKNEIKPNKKVSRVIRNGRKLQVDCNDGSRYSADNVICTAPFSVLREITFEPGLPAFQQQAVNEIPYLPVTSFFFTADEPFWEEDNLPPTMWTSTILERIFALPAGGNPTAIFWGLINGARARVFDRLSRGERESLILNELARIRPSTRGRITLHKIHSWARYPHNRGAWAYWRPGQISKFSAVFTQPRHNIHFAGEHTATFSAGMEAAFESGERAAWEILDK